MSPSFSEFILSTLKSQENGVAWVAQLGSQFSISAQVLDLRILGVGPLLGSALGLEPS